MRTEGWMGIPPHVYERLKLCTKCFGITGVAMPSSDSPARFSKVLGEDGLERSVQVSGTGGLPLYIARCDCEATLRKPPRVGFTTDIFGEGWLGFEFCRVCALRLQDMNSKWSFIVCDECRPIVRRANESAGRLLIPVGRHSFVNSSGAAGRFKKLPDSLRDVLARPEILVEAAETMEDGFELEEQWGPAVIEFNLLESGLLTGKRPELIALDDYFFACAHAALTSEDRAVQLVRSMRPWG